MTSSDWSNVLALYQKTVCHGVLQCLQKQAGMTPRKGIYGAPVVAWLMMLQWLHGRGTLASAV